MTDLKAPFGTLAYFLDLHPDAGDFKADVFEGLSQPQKSLSPKYFYDEYGSKLFDQITELKEYYPTRTEKAVFLDHADEITAAIGARSAIFEYGSGSSDKVEWLVRGLDKPVAMWRWTFQRSPDRKRDWARRRFAGARLPPFARISMRRLNCRKAHSPRPHNGLAIFQDRPSAI